MGMKEFVLACWAILGFLGFLTFLVYNRDEPQCRRVCKGGYSYSQAFNGNPGSNICTCLKGGE